MPRFFTLGRTIVGFVLTLAGTVDAKPSHCRKDCGPVITSCLARVPSNKLCTGTKAEKRACRGMHKAQRKICHHLVKRCKEENPGTSGIGVPGTVPPGTSGCGTFLAAWGTHGAGNGQFDHPLAVATDTSGNIFVGEGLFAGRIQKFDANGAFIAKWGSYGTGNGQFAGPTAVTTDASGNIYVADQNNDRIQKFACP